MRKRYDQYGENGLKNGGGGGNFKFHDAFNVFEQFFGGRGGFTFNTGGAQFQFSSNMGGTYLEVLIRACANHHFFKMQAREHNNSNDFANNNNSSNSSSNAV